MTDRTAGIPGSTATRASGIRVPAASPGKPGTHRRTATTSSTASPDSTPNAVRQPSAPASAVPAGTPRDSARVIPASTTAIARPRRSAGTIRAA